MKNLKIRIESGFMSALDKCPGCGEEHGVASEVECRACGYHAGSDLSLEWAGHCEEELKSIPSGVTLDFAHEGENGDDYYFDFSVDSGADLAAVMEFFERIAHGPQKAVRIGSDCFDLDAKLLRIMRTGVFDEYRSTPTEVSRWKIATLEELAAICTEIEETPNPNGTDWSRSAWECDYSRVRKAITARLRGAVIWVAQDDDGYYFAIEEAE